MKFSMEDFFSKCDQNRRKLRIWSHLLKKFFLENFIFLSSDASDIFIYGMRNSQKQPPEM